MKIGHLDYLRRLAPHLENHGLTVNLITAHQRIEYVTKIDLSTGVICYEKSFTYGILPLENVIGYEVMVSGPGIKAKPGQPTIQTLVEWVEDRAKREK